MDDDGEDELRDEAIRHRFLPEQQQYIWINNSAPSWCGTVWLVTRSQVSKHFSLCAHAFDLPARATLAPLRLGSQRSRASHRQRWSLALPSSRAG